MNNVYFVADTHFGVDAIFRYENRPFNDAAHMDAVLVARWNAKVSNLDTVYVLGDFGAYGYEAEVLSKSNGKKYLVKGNYDTKSNAFYRETGFEEVYDHPISFEEIKKALAGA